MIVAHARAGLGIVEAFAQAGDDRACCFRRDMRGSAEMRKGAVSCRLEQSLAHQRVEADLAQSLGDAREVLAERQHFGDSIELLWRARERRPRRLAERFAQRMSPGCRLALAGRDIVLLAIGGQAGEAGVGIEIEFSPQRRECDAFRRLAKIARSARDLVRAQRPLCAAGRQSEGGEAREKAKQFERGRLFRGSLFGRLERTVAEHFFAVLQRALRERPFGEIALKRLVCRVLAEATLRGENHARLVLQVRAFGRVRVIFVAVALALGELGIVGDHFAEGAIFRQAFARLLHRLLHLRRLVGSVCAGLALRVRTKAAMASDMPEDDREFVVGKRPIMRRRTQAPRRGAAVGGRFGQSLRRFGEPIAIGDGQRAVARQQFADLIHSEPAAMDDAPLAARGSSSGAFRLSRLGNERGIEAACPGGDNCAALAVQFENRPSAGSNADVKTEYARHVDNPPIRRNRR